MKADDFLVEDLDDGTLKREEPPFQNETNSLSYLSWQRRCDGEHRLLSWSCRVLFDEDGNVSGALSSARDITNQHRQNERVKRLNSILKGIRDINQLITQETSAERLLDGACENLVGPFGFVSALFSSNPTAKR
ncbi:MAG: hypothetical protein GXP32_02415 [Kiritimatiellaeota bacterium]|nr:hypothetical protein [Kiritimatiellota bacterium]